MGQLCRVCEHPERARIELGLMWRHSYARLSALFGVTKDSLYRHKRGHMPPAVKAAMLVARRPTDLDLDQLRRTESEGLLQHLVAQRARLNVLVELGEDAGDLSAAASAHRVLLQNLMATARLLGEIHAGDHHTINNLIVSPTYLTLRSALLRALQPHPEARRAVARVLGELEGEVPVQTGTQDRKLLEGVSRADA